MYLQLHINILIQEMYNCYLFTLPEITCIALYIIKVQICFKWNTECVKKILL